MHRVSALSRERSTRRASSYEPSEADLARLSVLQSGGVPADFSGSASDVSAESMSPPLSPMVSDVSSAASPEPQLDAHSDTIEPINNDPDNSDSQALAKFTELIEKRKRFTSSKHRRIGRSMPNIPLTFDSNDASEGMRGFCIGEDDCDVTVSRTVSGSATGENACPRSRRSSRTGIVSHPIALPPLSLNNDMCSATMPSSHHDSVVATPQRPQRRAVAPMPLERVDLQAGGGAAERGGLYSMRNGFPSIPTASDLAQLESDISATLQRGRTHSMSSHRSTDRARSLSPPVTRHRHRIQMHGDGTADDDRQWLEEKLKQGLANMATELRKLIQSIEMDTSFSNSITATPTMLMSPKTSDSTNEDYEDGAISESPSLLRVAVDGIGTPSRTPHMQESSVMNKKVQGLCAKLLDAWEQGTLCSADFRSATSSLAKLLEHNAPEHAARNIKSILMQIATPARLMECKEHQDMVDDDHLPNDMERVWELTTDSLHMPRYIQEKMTTHFGMNGAGGRRARSVEDDGSDSNAMVMKQPKAQFLENLAEGEKPCRNDFELVKQISAGAYGSVYIGIHKVTKEQFAIKVMKKKQMLAKNCASQVLAEKEVLKFAQNPFVVQFYCSFSTPQSLYIVMEHASGGDLAALLKKLGALTERESRRYFAETVLAVEYIHEYGIVHRDLKPDNLIIAHNGHIKLTDFGLSKIGLMKRTTRWIDDDATSWTAASVRDSGGGIGTATSNASNVVNSELLSAMTDAAPVDGHTGCSDDAAGDETSGEVYGVFGDLEYDGVDGVATRSDVAGAGHSVDHCDDVTDAALLYRHPALNALVTSPADSRRGSGVATNGLAIAVTGAVVDETSCTPPQGDAVGSSSRAVSDDARTASGASSGEFAGAHPRSSGSSVAVTPPLSPAPVPPPADTNAVVDAEQEGRGSSGAMFGTPDYIAPEVILAHGYDASVDWWSMGIILYELVVGEPPFTGCTPKEIFEKVVRDPVVWPSDDEFDEPPSGNLRDLVGQLLEKDPAARIGTVKADSAFAFNEETFEIKGHPFFEMALDDDNGGVDLIDWERMLEEQACFVPQLDDDTDTSYFDLRDDRYKRNDLSSSEDSDSDDETSSVHTDHSSLGLFRNFSCVNLFQSPSPMRSRSRSPATITLPEHEPDPASATATHAPPADAPNTGVIVEVAPSSPVPHGRAEPLEELPHVLLDEHSNSDDGGTPETPSSVDTDYPASPPAHHRPHHAPRSAAIPLRILADTAPDSDTTSDGGHSCVSGASSPVSTADATAPVLVPLAARPNASAPPTAAPTPIHPNDPAASPQRTPKPKTMFAKTRLICRVSDERRDTRSAPVSIPVQNLQTQPPRAAGVVAPRQPRQKAPGGKPSPKKQQQPRAVQQSPATQPQPHTQTQERPPVQSPQQQALAQQQRKQLSRAQHQQMLLRQQQQQQQQQPPPQQQQQRTRQQQVQQQQQQLQQRVQTFPPSAQQRRRQSNATQYPPPLVTPPPGDAIHSPPQAANADMSVSSPLGRGVAPLPGAGAGSALGPKRASGRPNRRPACTVGLTSRCTHLCVNWSLTFGFGFSIDTKNGMHRVSNIDRGGPAEVAGIRAGYEIIGVNQTNIAGWTRYKVARFVKTIGGQDNIGRQVVFHCIRIKSEADKKKSASSKQKTTKTKQTWDWLSRITTRSPARSPMRSPIVSPTSESQTSPGGDHSGSDDLVRGLGPRAQHPRGGGVAPTMRAPESRSVLATSPPARRTKSGKAVAKAKSPPPPSASGSASTPGGSVVRSGGSVAAAVAPAITPESPTRGFWKVGRSSSLRGTRSTTSTYDPKHGTPSPTGAGVPSRDGSAKVDPTSSPPAKASSPSSPLVFANNPLMRMSPSRASPVPASPLRNADSPRRSTGNMPSTVPAAHSSPASAVRVMVPAQQVQQAPQGRVRRQSLPLATDGSSVSAAGATPPSEASSGASSVPSRAPGSVRRTRSKSLRSVGNSPLGTSPTGALIQGSVSSVVSSVSASVSMESLSDLGTSPPPADPHRSNLAESLPSPSFKDRPPPVFELDAESEIASLASAAGAQACGSPAARQSSGLHTITVSDSSPTTASEDLTFELVPNEDATRMVSTDSGYLDQQGKPQP